jgi:hypothetical protein
MNDLLLISILSLANWYAKLAKESINTPNSIILHVSIWEGASLSLHSVFALAEANIVIITQEPQREIHAFTLEPWIA